MYHYTYKVIHPNGKYYVGRHSAKKEGDSYVGSGKWVRSLKDKTVLQKTVLQYYASPEELKKAEVVLIEKHIDDPNNMNFNRSSCGFSSGSLNPNYSEEAKKRNSKRMTGKNNHMYGKKLSKETKEKISKSVTGELNGFYGKTHSEETKKKMSELAKGREFSQETKDLLSEQRKGSTPWNKGVKGLVEQTDAAKEKIANSWKERPKITCEHCNKEFYPNTYKRWHGDNCKKNI